MGKAEINLELVALSKEFMANKTELQRAVDGMRRERKTRKSEFARFKSICEAYGFHPIRMKAWSIVCGQNYEEWVASNKKPSYFAASLKKGFIQRQPYKNIKGILDIEIRLVKLAMEINTIDQSLFSRKRFIDKIKMNKQDITKRFRQKSKDIGLKDSKSRGYILAAKLGLDLTDKRVLSPTTLRNNKEYYKRAVVV